MKKFVFPLLFALLLALTACASDPQTTDRPSDPSTDPSTSSATTVQPVGVASSGTLNVPISLTEMPDGDATIKVYLDGELQENMTSTVDTIVLDQYTLRFPRNRGIKRATIKVERGDGPTYFACVYTCTLDFDAMTYRMDDDIAIIQS